MRRRGGFTIIELLIVVAFVAILGAIAAIGSRALLNRGRLAEAASTVERQVQDARRLAKREDRTIALEVVAVGEDWGINVDGTTTVLPGGVDVSSGTVDLDLEPPFGTYAGAPVDIVLNAGGDSATVTVTGVLARTVVH